MKSMTIAVLFRSTSEVSGTACPRFWLESSSPRAWRSSLEWSPGAIFRSPPAEVGFGMVRGSGGLWKPWRRGNGSSNRQLAHHPQAGTRWPLSPRPPVTRLPAAFKAAGDDDGRRSEEDRRTSIDHLHPGVTKGWCLVPSSERMFWAPRLPPWIAPPWNCWMLNPETSGLAWLFSLLVPREAQEASRGSLFGVWQR